MASRIFVGIELALFSCKSFLSATGIKRKEASISTWLSMRALLFVSLAMAACAFALDPVRLNVVDRSYVSLIVGTPGTLVRFRVNLTSDDIYIHRSLDDRSQSFFMSVDGQSGHESFFIGKHRVRLPVKFSSLSPDRPFAVFQQPHEGVLGFGYYSPLWLHWDTATVTPSTIYLNEINFHAAMHPDRPTPVMSYHDVWVSHKGPICAHPSSTLTLLPKEFFYEKKKHVLIRGNPDLCTHLFSKKCPEEQEFDLSKYEMVSPKGIHFKSVVVTPMDQIWLGGEFFRHHVVFLNRRQGVVSISESIYSFTEYSYSSWFSLIIAVLAIVYVLIEYEHKKVLRALEIYGIAAQLVAFVSVTFGLLVSRHILAFCELPPITFLVLIASSIALTCGFIALNRKEYRYIERMLFMSSALLVLWLCGVEEHTSHADKAYLLFITSCLNIYSWFTFMDGFARRLPLWPFLFLVAFSHSWVLVFGTLIPVLAATEYTLWVWYNAYLFYLGFILTPAWVFQILFQQSLATEKATSR